MDIEAYILIGGRSSRLGTDKAFVEIGGTTLAERALNKVREARVGSKTTFIAGSETQFANQPFALNAPFIFDLVQGLGPLGGLHAALAYAQAEWIFLMACDYPFVSTELIKLLANEVSDEFGAVVPIQSDRRVQPLCAFYRVKDALPFVESIVATPRVPPPMRDLVTAMKPRLVTANEYSDLEGSARFFININTPYDLTGIDMESSPPRRERLKDR